MLYGSNHSIINLYLSLPNIIHNAWYFITDPSKAKDPTFPREPQARLLWELAEEERGDPCSETLRPGQDPFRVRVR